MYSQLAIDEHSSAVWGVQLVSSMCARKFLAKSFSAGYSLYGGIKTVAAAASMVCVSCMAPDRMRATNISIISYSRAISGGKYNGNCKNKKDDNGIVLVAYCIDMANLNKNKLELQRTAHAHICRNAHHTHTPSHTQGTSIGKSSYAAHQQACARGVTLCYLCDVRIAIATYAVDAAARPCIPP